MNPLAVPLARWYESSARDLPWRHDGTTPWGVLVSEIMLQQTPANRVIPYWLDWLDRWPTPGDLAQAGAAAVIQAWGTLGYPRRALRLRECAGVIAGEYAGEVPSDEETLRTLPGIGEYTAAAVAAFAYGRRAVVLDTNIRRVIARAHTGQSLPLPHLTTAERTMAAELLPKGTASVRWNQATMELGAVICRTRDPACDSCPVKGLCAWRQAGYPDDQYAARRRGQGWEGTDRQVRGRIMALLRQADPESVPSAALLATSPDPDQAQRALGGLVADGLAVRDGEAVRLP